MIKYPVSESSFREIRRNGFAYVDKTMYVHQLVETAKSSSSAVPGDSARVC